jgi:hypothetical protein
LSAPTLIRWVRPGTEGINKTQLPSFNSGSACYEYRRPFISKTALEEATLLTGKHVVPRVYTFFMPDSEK